MCSIGALGLATSLAGSLTGGLAQYQQARAQAEAARGAAEYQARAAAGEAERMHGLARAEIEKGAGERSRVIRAGLARQGELAGGLGASGFALDQGSPLSLLGQSAEEIQHEASLAGQNAALRAWKHQAGATGSANEGAFARFQAQMRAAQAGNNRLGLAGTILGNLGRGLS